MREERLKKAGKLQICKKKNALVFAGDIAGERVFWLNLRQGGRKKCVLREGGCVIDDHRLYSLSPEQAALFAALEREFDGDHAAAKRGEGGFLRADFEGETLYVCRLSDRTYQFISETPDGDVRQYRGCACDYLCERGDGFFSFPVGAGEADESRREYAERVRRGEELLLRAGDPYLECEVKYLEDRADKAEADFLIRSDGKPRFFREKEVYGKADTSLSIIRPCVHFGRIEGFLLSVTTAADGVKYSAVYRFGSDIFIGYTSCKKIRCLVDGEVSEQLRALTDPWLKRQRAAENN